MVKDEFKGRDMIDNLAELEIKQAVAYRAKNKTKQKPKDTFGLDYLFYWTEIICALSFIYPHIHSIKPNNNNNNKTTNNFPNKFIPKLQCSLDGLVKLSDVLLI